MQYNSIKKNRNLEKIGNNYLKSDLISKIDHYFNDSKFNITSKNFTK